MRFVSDSSIVWDGNVCTAVRLCVRTYVRTYVAVPSSLCTIIMLDLHFKRWKQ